jgi:integrase
MLILSTTRLNETLGARFDEVDIEKRLWTIAHRMKRNRPRAIPLTAPMLNVLERQERVRTGDLLFPGRYNGVLGAFTLALALKRLGITGTTMHGVRSTFRDWAGDLVDVDRATAEQQLAHAISNATEDLPRRLTAIKRRRKALEACRGWPSGETMTDNVIAFHASVRPT